HQWRLARTRVLPPRPPGLRLHHPSGSMTVDQAVSAEAALVVAPARSERRIAGPIAIGFALFSALVTFLVLANLTPILPTHYVVVTLLLVNAVAMCVLIALIAREMFQIVQARRTGRAAARLHLRILGLFSIVAAVPAILVAIVASVTLDRGLDRLFNTRTRAMIENSLSVSQAYLRDHAQMVGSDIMVLSFDISRGRPLFDQNRDQMRQFMTVQAAIRGLSAAIIFDKNLNVVERAEVPTTQVFATPSKEQLATVSDTEPQIVLLPHATYAAAVVKLKNY